MEEIINYDLDKYLELVEYTDEYNNRYAEGYAKRFSEWVSDKISETYAEKVMDEFLKVANTMDYPTNDDADTDMEIVECMVESADLDGYYDMDEFLNKFAVMVEA